MCCVVWFEPWRAVDELGELWSAENEVTKDGHTQVVKKRGIDPGHEIIRVFTVRCELQLGGSGEEY